MATILVLEDDDDLRYTITRMLQSQGYTVLEASDGERGAQVYTRIPIDLVITDLFMPEKEGMETITDLKREAPHIKIIAISGGGGKGYIEYLDVAKGLGAEETFEKPVDMNELLDAIEQLLSQKS